VRNRNLEMAEVLRRRADALELAAVNIELLTAALEDVTDEHLVIFFRKEFNSGVTYDYAAIRFKPQKDYETGWRWATTGPVSPKYYTTDEFVYWLVNDRGVQEVWIAEQWERVV